MKRTMYAAGTAALVGLLAFGATTPAQASTQSTALSYARAQLGDVYSQANPQGPNHWDCSGLMQASYKAAGKTLPRVAQAQYNATARRTVHTRQVGDLVFFGYGTKSIQHVGIYVGMKNGKGMIINANTGAYRGRKVVEAPISEYNAGPLTTYYGHVK